MKNQSVAWGFDLNQGDLSVTLQEKSPNSLRDKDLSLLQRIVGRANLNQISNKVEVFWKHNRTKYI